MICPAGCGRSAPLGMLMCRQCWHIVPAELQRPVWQAWRQLNKAIDKDFDPRAIETLKREHAEAKAAAIDYVRERICQKELFA